MVGKHGVLFLDLIIVKLEDISTILINGNKVTLSLKAGNSPSSISKTFKDSNEAEKVLKSIYDTIANMFDERGDKPKPPKRRGEEDRDDREEKPERREPQPVDEVILESDEEEVLDEAIEPEEVVEEEAMEEEVIEEPAPKKSKNTKGARVVKQQ